MIMADQVQQILDPLKVDTETKAQAWDAFKQSADTDDFTKRIQAIKIPDEIKAQLWDLKKSLSAMADPALDEEDVSAGPVTRFAQSAWNQVNPIPVLTTPEIFPELGKQLLAHPINTVAKMFGMPGAKAYMQAKNGDYAGAAGTLVTAYGPMALTMFKPSKTVNVAPKLTPEQTEAVQWGKANNIPMSLGTQTGRSSLQGAEGLMRNLPGAAKQFDEARLAGNEALYGALDKLMPGPKVEPEIVGQSIIGQNGALQSRILEANANANAAYGKLRDIIAKGRSREEAMAANRRIETSGSAKLSTDPFGKVYPVGQVNLVPAKRWAAPIVDEIEGAATVGLNADQSAIQLAQLRATSPTYSLLRRLLETADHVDLTDADVLLGELKRITRGTLERENFEPVAHALRSRAEGLAASAIDPISKEIDNAAVHLGSDAVMVLREGRNQTRLKYRLDDMLQNFRENKDIPAFKRLISPNNINELKDIASTAPEVLPGLATGALQEIIKESTNAQGYLMGATASRKFKNMAPTTKEILFGDKAADIEKSFRLASMMRVDANPSGTARVGILAGIGGSGATAAAHGDLLTPALYGAGLLTARELAKKLYWGQPLKVAIPRTAAGAFAIP